MKIKQGFIVRRVGEENIAVPVGEKNTNFRGMIKLNETGTFLWNYFLEEHSEQDAVASLCAEYEVAEDVACRDVKRFIKILFEHGFAE
jgi:hypothetical protein